MNNNNPHNSSFTCPVHPDRAGQVTKADGTTPCWECWLGPEVFRARFGANFYTDPNPQSNVAEASSFGMAKGK